MAGDDDLLIIQGPEMRNQSAGDLGGGGTYGGTIGTWQGGDTERFFHFIDVFLNLL